MPVYTRGFKHVNQFVVFSTYMQDMMRRQNVESVCVPNATQLFTPEPIDTQGRNILYVGRLEKIKGVQHLIDALPNVIETYPDTQLVIAGIGTYEEALKQRVHELNLASHVVFAGHRTRDELYEHYKQATVVVVPSVWPEPFGKVGIEALSVGRPVIASDVGGIAEWLDDGETGYLVPPADPVALGQKIKVLFAQGDQLARFSHAAQHRAQDFSIERHAERMLGLYEKVIAAHMRKKK